jgi:thiol-disulfide isomerase/thioredoxin
MSPGIAMSASGLSVHNQSITAVAVLKSKTIFNIRTLKIVSFLQLSKWGVSRLGRFLTFQPPKTNETMNVKKCVRALLCLYLTLIIAMDAVKAQTLKVGDTLPPELWSLPLQVVNHPDGKETLTLGEYKDKLIILDFWATWCSPCIAMLPKQDSLQRQFKDQLQILPVTYQTAEEVSTFMEKYEKRKGIKNSLPKVVGDNALRAAFPHTYLPHYVWIDAGGIVKAITGHEEVKAERIAQLLANNGSDLSLKEDPTLVAYRKETPLYINGNGGNGENLLFYSLLGSYSPNLLAGYNIIRDSVSSRVVAKNISLGLLLRIAFAEKGFLGQNRVILEVGRPDRFTTDLSGKAYVEWQKQQNAFCYEIVIPASRNNELLKLMQEDMRKYFTSYAFEMKKREVACLVIKRLPDSTGPLSKGGDKLLDLSYGSFILRNQKIGVLVGFLNSSSMQLSPFPIIDDTGLTDTVDLHLEADMSDLTELNQALKSNGLFIVQEERLIDMLVIKDKS